MQLDCLKQNYCTFPSLLCSVKKHENPTRSWRLLYSQMLLEHGQFLALNSYSQLLVVDAFFNTQIVPSG